MSKPRKSQQICEASLRFATKFLRLSASYHGIFKLGGLWCLSFQGSKDPRQLYFTWRSSIGRTFLRWQQRRAKFSCKVVSVIISQWGRGLSRDVYSLSRITGTLRILSKSPALRAANVLTMMPVLLLPRELSHLGNREVNAIPKADSNLPLLNSTGYCSLSCIPTRD